MPAADVVDLIVADHREVERLFELLKQQPTTRGLNYRPSHATRDDLRQQASNAGLTGTSNSTKGEIKADLLAHAQQSGE